MTEPAGKLVPMLDEPKEPDTRSFDAFWAEQLGEVKHDTIRGVRIQVPRDMPLRLLREIETETATEVTESVVRRFARVLFGGDVVEQWIDAGMGTREFQVVVRWGTQHAKGSPVTWQEAYDSLQDDEAGAGKARSRRTRSGASGPRSRRTSTASTGSTPPPSPA